MPDHNGAAPQDASGGTVVPLPRSGSTDLPTELSPPQTANPARIYDYLLGGKDNFELDRLAARQALAAMPEIRRLARANRRFLVRAVRYTAGVGVRQFIDLGTGFPTSPNLHEVAQAIHSKARVVYVDNDPVVTAHNRALRATVPGVTAIEGDVRHPHGILADTGLLELIDFAKPVVVLFVAVLHFVRPEEDPARTVAAFAERMAPGSYLAISHGVSDHTGDEALAGVTSAYQDHGVSLVPRTTAEVASWFHGFKLIRPGLADVTRWHPGQTARLGPAQVIAGVGCRTSLR